MAFLSFDATLTDKQATVIKWQVILIKGRCLWQCAIHVGGKHTPSREKEQAGRGLLAKTL